MLALLLAACSPAIVVIEAERCPPSSVEPIGAASFTLAATTSGDYEQRIADWNESWASVPPDVVAFHEDEARCFSPPPAGLIFAVDCTGADPFGRTTCGMQSRPCPVQLALLGLFAGRLGILGDVWLK